MASKFSMVNTSGLFDTAAHVEATDRMQGAMEELKIKHDREDRAEAARQASLAAAQREKDTRAAASKAAAVANAAIADSSFIRPKRQQSDEEEAEEELDEDADNNDDDDDDDDDAWLAELDQDPELERLRASRLAQLQAQHKKQQELLAKGHGEYREITQDEFLKEVTSSPLVLVHFYHNDFERCKIMDMHLNRLAKHHIECKFLKLNAEKAPFFVDKLRVRVLPTVVGFRDGVAFPQRIIGFDGLSADDEDEELSTFGSRAGHKKPSDTFPTIALARRLEAIGVLQHNDADEDEERW
ncbi:hypothetical protein P43SY_008752 [Pythium insidiosum]|uniref:Thioredoxin domain-containing protein n=1 Tax=Pythium insidiosum TaxID=114742 RepID=A0AAD5Q8A7_PYTIN|nr:hypothetical protein P43SY_008752 [Pythium insidiosum]